MTVARVRPIGGLPLAGQLDGTEIMVGSQQGLAVGITAQKLAVQAALYVAPIQQQLLDLKLDKASVGVAGGAASFAALSGKADYFDPGLYLRTANNLSDLPNKTSARNNIGLSTGDSLTLASVGAVNSYFLGGNEFATISSGYTIMSTINGTQFFAAGSSDPTTYNSNDAHQWRSKDNNTNYGSLGASGLSISNPISHSVDNAYSFGRPAVRATVVYAATGTINTSDARSKTEVSQMTTAEAEASADLARQIGTFKFLQAVIDKGEDARTHIGMTVQQAIAIMQSHGLDPLAYAFICHDTWDAVAPVPAVEGQEAEHDEDGRETRSMVMAQPSELGREAGDRYGFRVDQLLLFIARGLEQRISALEAANNRGA